MDAIRSIKQTLPNRIWKFVLQGSNAKIEYSSSRKEFDSHYGYDIRCGIRIRDGEYEVWKKVQALGSGKESYAENLYTTSLLQDASRYLIQELEKLAEQYQLKDLFIVQDRDKK